MPQEPLTFSHAIGLSDIPIIEETTGQLLRSISTSHGNNDAVVAVWQERKFNYRELFDVAQKAAKSLIAMGFKKGDRIAILSTNNPEWIFLQMAVPMMGGVLVSVNPAFKTHELAYVLKDSDSKAIFLLEKYKHSEYLKMLYEICPEIKSSQAESFSTTKLPLLRSAILIGEEKKAGLFTWSEFIEKGSATSDDDLVSIEETLSPDEVINMQYTSGTTGFPKGVCLTHRNVINNGFFVGENLHFTHKDRLAIPVPFFHCFGMVLSNLACITHGATMVLPSEHFDAHAALFAVEKEKCTALHGVPTMFSAELSDPEFSKFDLSSLRTGIMAGAPCPVELMKHVLEKMHMRDVTICYGLTECSPVTNQTKIEDPIKLRIETVGPPSPHVEVRISDQDGRTVPVGVQGEILARGYCVMKGYYKKEKETAETIDRDGWLHTGDLGEMNESGYVKITGRIKDMIIRGGENVYPREIEEFLYTNPKIDTVSVFGVPDAKFGEQIAAWIKLKRGLTANEQEIIDFCKGKIAHYKIPKYIKFVDEFPMTTSGKLKKFIMREMYAKELG